MRGLSLPIRYLAAELDYILHPLWHRVHPFIDRLLFQFLFPSIVSDVFDCLNIPVRH